MYETPNSIVFRSSATEFILVYEHKEDAKAAIDRIEKAKIRLSLFFLPFYVNLK